MQSGSKAVDQVSILGKAPSVSDKKNSSNPDSGRLFSEKLDEAKNNSATKKDTKAAEKSPTKEPDSSAVQSEDKTTPFTKIGDQQITNNAENNSNSQDSKKLLDNEFADFDIEELISLEETPAPTLNSESKELAVKQHGQSKALQVENTDLRLLDSIQKQATDSSNQETTLQQAPSKEVAAEQEKPRSMESAMALLAVMDYGRKVLQTETSKTESPLPDKPAAIIGTTLGAPISGANGDVKLPGSQMPIETEKGGLPIQAENKSTAPASTASANSDTLSGVPMKGSAFSDLLAQANQAPQVIGTSQNIQFVTAQQMATKAPDSTGSYETPVGSENWGQGLADKVTTFNLRTDQKIEIRLNPLELGPVSIHVKMTDGNVTNMQFVSHSADVRGLVEQSLPHLRQMLSEQGLNLGQASVGSDQPGGNQQNSSNQEKSISSSNTASANPDDVQEDEISGIIAGRVNFFA